MSAAKTSPPEGALGATEKPSGGEHHETPIWDELADRWAALQPLLARTVDEDWRECIHGAPGPCERCGAAAGDEEAADA